MGDLKKQVQYKSNKNIRGNSRADRENTIHSEMNPQISNNKLKSHLMTEAQGTPQRSHKHKPTCAHSGALHPQHQTQRRAFSAAKKQSTTGANVSSKL